MLFSLGALFTNTLLTANVSFKETYTELELDEVAGDKKHWYETLPGILTGIAAVIGAIASLYVAIDGKRESTSMGEEAKIGENRSTNSVAKLFAPVMEKPKCNSAREWPPDNHFFPIYWHPVEGAGSYGIEIDLP